jgi:hypothetical protein
MRAVLCCNVLAGSGDLLPGTVVTSSEAEVCRGDGGGGKDGSWEVLLYGTHIAAQVTVPADEGRPPHVLLLTCHHGIREQRENH